MHCKPVAVILLLAIFLPGCEPPVEQLFRLGDDYYNGKQYEKALEQYDRIIHHNGKIQQAYYDRALCYIELQKYPQALGDLNKLVGMQTQGDYIITFNKNFPNASEEMQWQVDYHEVLFQRAIVRYYMDSLRSASADLQACIDNQYRAGTCTIWKGLLWLRAGEKEKGCALFQKVFQEATDSAEKDLARSMIDSNCVKK